MTLLIKQTLNLLIAEQPAVPGAPLTDEDLDIEGVVYQFPVSCTLTAAGRIALAASASNVPLGIGMLTTGEFLYLELDQNATIKITNGTGTSQSILINGGGPPAVIPMEFTALSISNPSSSTPVTGKYVAAGN